MATGRSRSDLTGKKVDRSFDKNPPGNSSDELPPPKLNKIAQDRANFTKCVWLCWYPPLLLVYIYGCRLFVCLCFALFYVRR